MNDERVDPISVRHSAWMTLIVLLVIALVPELPRSAFSLPASLVVLALISMLRPSEPGRSSPMLRGPDR